ncbi:alpha/beta hydrolase [Neobacillus drentensis]|uniref:alpha/beta fold hydrolase n=1 Tax=Neobacillus drentensis TaxID=220684 RepID=UPI003000A874
MASSLTVNSRGIKLNALDYGGNISRDILLLHGLAGRGREWNNTAEWLTQFGRVIALDQRGHGESAEDTSDFSRLAYVEDAINTIEQHCKTPIILIGQSMGGINAFLVATKRPELVQTLIIVEAAPNQSRGIQTGIRSWLEKWNVPFKTFDDAWEFFGKGTFRGKTFAELLDKREDGYYPAFRIDSMVHSMEDLESRDYWEEWKKIKCTTLVVTGEKGFISKEVVNDMVNTIPNGQSVCISESGHELHLDQPREWRRTVEAFLRDTLKNL